MKKIVSTGKSSEMPKGKTYVEGDDLAKVLVDGGFATYASEKVASALADKAGKVITQTKEKNDKAGPAKTEKVTEPVNETGTAIQESQTPTETETK